jgi:hypothetical protein
MGLAAPITSKAAAESPMVALFIEFPNASDQRPRATRAEYESGASSRGSLHLIRWTFVANSIIDDVTDIHPIR